MTRFEKEMRKRYPAYFEETFTGEMECYVIPEKALLVNPSNMLTLVYEVRRDMTISENDVSEDYPRISHPYLVRLCGGNEEEAKRILKEHAGIPFSIFTA